MDEELSLPPTLDHHHYGVSVADLHRSIAWYRAALGFDVERTFRLPSPPTRAAMLRRGDLRVELFEVKGATPLAPARREPHADLQSHGNKHPAFAVDNLDGLISWIRTRELDLVFVVPPHIGRACFLRDPDGNLIEFVERRREP